MLHEKKISEKSNFLFNDFQRQKTYLTYLNVNDLAEHFNFDNIFLLLLELVTYNESSKK